MWLKEVLVAAFSLIGIRFRNFANGADNHLCRQLKLIANIVVAESVQFNLAKSLILESNLADEVAGSIKTLHGTQ